MSIFNNPLNRWSNVLGGALAHAVGSGVLSYAFSIFIKPIAAEYGWNRAAVGLAASFFFVANGVGYLALGSLINRWGMRQTSILFVTIYALAVMSVAAVSSSLAVFYLIFVVIGFFGSVGSAMPYSVVICAWFDDRRGWALGILAGGAAIGVSAMPSAAAYVLAHYGWRAGYLSMGTVALVVSVSSLLFLIRMPPSYDTKAAWARRARRAGASTFRQILKRKEFWLIGFPIIGISAALFGVIGSLVPLMTDHGMSTAEAAAVVSFIGVSSWSSRFVVGYLLDKVFAPFVACGVFVATIIGIVLMMRHGPGVGAFIAVSCMGFSQGAEADLVTFMVSRYFSPSAYSKAVGAEYGVWAWGAAAGNGFSNYMFYLTHSYDAALWTFAVLVVVCAAILTRLGPYNFPRGAELDENEMVLRPQPTG